MAALVPRGVSVSESFIRAVCNSLSAALILPATPISAEWLPRKSHATQRSSCYATQVGCYYEQAGRNILAKLID
ncbi:hypothetical protein GMORB2_2066 [Geosmithia morbida]|uniref:Uncharacterized protein n=1 Tax=Geosmithia morbida TaxID=1094350 RepID=A0A9P4YR97_9HYPO|nr:uncharacterized protein GMORB2_2066 [Geosmithia morbida]KAF4121658.1 hypothetical protein GMORB2_2066 [Geosmithia morbida]